MDDYIRYDLPSRLNHVGHAAELYGILDNVTHFQKISNFKQKVVYLRLLISRVLFPKGGRQFSRSSDHSQPRPFRSHDADSTV